MRNWTDVPDVRESVDIISLHKALEKKGYIIMEGSSIAKITSDVCIVNQYENLKVG